MFRFVFCYHSLCFVGFGIVEKLVAHQTLAIAYHPDFTAQSAEDDDRGGETVFGMLCQMRKQCLYVAATNGLCGSFAELMAADVLRHLLDEGGNGEHGQLTIAMLPQ